MDQILAIKLTAEKYKGKGRKLYAAFTELKEANDGVDRTALKECVYIWCEWALAGRDCK